MHCFFSDALDSNPWSHQNFLQSWRKRCCCFIRKILLYKSLWLQWMINLANKGHDQLVQSHITHSSYCTKVCDCNGWQIWRTRGGVCITRTTRTRSYVRTLHVHKILNMNDRTSWIMYQMIGATNHRPSNTMCLKAFAQILPSTDFIIRHHLIFGALSPRIPSPRWAPILLTLQMAFAGHAFGGAVDQRISS